LKYLSRHYTKAIMKMPSPLVQPMPLRSLRISTCLMVHPDFIKAPTVFARRHGVDLADDIFPETSFKKDPETYKKTSTVRANIHLVRHGAIRVFTERDAEGDSYVRGVELSPSLLLYRNGDIHLCEADLAVSLSMLSAKVTPLLANPRDVCHIVPGLAGGGHVAYWSYIESEILLPGIDIPCLHGLSHQDTGPAQGSTRTRIQLGDKWDDHLIRFTAASWETSDPTGVRSVKGVRVKLCLRGQAVVASFGRLETTGLLNDTNRLISFRAPDVARVHQVMMSQLDGTYLRVPPEWTARGDGKPITHAKTIALMSLLTSIPLEDLRAMDEEIRHPSLSTRERLDLDVQMEAARLKPVPVSTLFGSEVYAAQPTPIIPHTANLVDPQVKTVYGPHTTSHLCQ
jgi:hypothetical protein